VDHGQPSREKKKQGATYSTDEKLITSKKKVEGGKLVRDDEHARVNTGRRGMERD